MRHEMRFSLCTIQTSSCIWIFTPSVKKNENELTQRNEREEKIDAHVTFMQFEFMNFHSYTIDNL